jgi:hypothetical protein
MTRYAVIALTASALLCSGCATTDLAGYPANLWPERIDDSSCARISGTYDDRTEDVWPTKAMRGSTATDRASLAQLLAYVSPGSRPQDFLSAERVEVDASRLQMRVFDVRNDVAILSGWQCSEGGALVATVKRGANGEGSFNAYVEIRFELRRATDRSLIVHSFEQFSDLSVRTLLRETWFRFLPVDAEPRPASTR